MNVLFEQVHFPLCLPRSQGALETTQPTFLYPLLFVSQNSQYSGDPGKAWQGCDLLCLLRGRAQEV